MPETLELLTFSLFYDLGGFLDQAEAEQLEQALERAGAT